MSTGDWPLSLASLIMSSTAIPRHSSWDSWLTGIWTQPLRKSLRHCGRQKEKNIRFTQKIIKWMKERSRRKQLAYSPFNFITGNIQVKFYKMCTNIMLVNVLKHSSFCDSRDKYKAEQNLCVTFARKKHAREKKKSRNYLKCTQTNTWVHRHTNSEKNTDIPLFPICASLNTLTTPLPVFWTYEKEWADTTDWQWVKETEK